MCKEQIITVIQTEAIQILRRVNGPGEATLDHPVRNSPAYISQHRLQEETRTTLLIHDVILIINQTLQCFYGLKLML